MGVAAIKSWGFSAVLLFGAMAIGAQAPPAGVRLTATTQNVSGAGEAIKIAISNWSTDAQKDEMIGAWTLTNTAAAGRGGRGGRGGGGAGGAGGGGRGAAAGRGGARGGRGAAPAADGPATDEPNSLPPDPDLVNADSPAPQAGRGGGRGGGAPAAPITPEASLAAALKKAPTLGTFWTSETVGYSIKYAYHEKQTDGGERIILATDRRVGGWNALWKPSGTASATDYAFSLIELHLSAAGDGEGRGVVVGKVAVDGQNKTISLDSYSTLPVVLKGVKRQSGN